MGALYAYAFRAGAPAAPPLGWPTASAIRRAPDLPTLVMVVHPRCPCSRASIDELSRLVTRLAGRLDTHVLFVRPPGAPADFAASDLFAGASLLAGVTLHVDDGGVEA